MEERSRRTLLQPNQPAEAAVTAEPPQLLLSSSSSDDDEGEEEEEEEFAFPSVSRDSPAGTAAPADELFADGRIRPVYYYPVFGHAAAQLPARHPPPRVRGQLGRLFLEERRNRSSSVSSTSTDDDAGGMGLELEGAPPESYCLWTPAGGSRSSPTPRRPPRKSSSTGSSVARWRRISELVVGRSHSDGNEKFVFFPAPPPQPPKAAGKEPNKAANREANKTNNKPSAIIGKKARPSEVVDAAAHRVAAAHGHGGAPRRTFLPYREELVGFFASVNGISRTHHYPL